MKQMLDLQRINRPCETFHRMNLVKLCQRGTADLAPIRVEQGGIIEVADQGSWNTDAERESIFEPFYRLHPREREPALALI
ncbi:hypothetical protein [Phyllobacterium meliloti]|uniref:hypothetical protein n=1 Tax=Phyllobacterium meliloti TaxID=555317 RepID=UPI001D1555D6|nr:hypothetical protein [Phyllobacterium sp. T1293]UGX88701.1 hypothetical protein LLE53_021930 [Phyllobacterium sp. T1293]